MSFVNSLWQAGTHLAWSCNDHGYDMKWVWAAFKGLQVIRSPRYIRSERRLCFSLTCQSKRIKYLIFVTQSRLFPAEMRNVMSAVTWLSDMVSQCIIIITFFSFLFHKSSPGNTAKEAWVAHLSLCESTRLSNVTFLPYLDSPDNWMSCFRDSSSHYRRLSGFWSQAYISTGADPWPPDDVELHHKWAASGITWCQGDKVWQQLEMTAHSSWQRYPFHLIEHIFHPRLLLAGLIKIHNTVNNFSDFLMLGYFMQTRTSDVCHLSLQKKKWLRCSVWGRACFD